MIRIMLFSISVCIFIGCGIQKQKSDCADKIKFLEQNFEQFKGKKYIDLAKPNYKEEFGLISHQLYLTDPNCFIGFKNAEIIKMLGNPHYTEDMYNKKITRYYFQKSCYQKCEPCFYWEFFFNDKNEVEYFISRKENFPDKGIK